MGDEGQILKTEVIVSVHVKEILKVDELDSVFSCKIDLVLSWRDQVRFLLSTAGRLIVLASKKHDPPHPSTTLTLWPYRTVWYL